MVMQEFLSLVVNSDSPRSEYRVRSGNGDRHSATHPKIKTTPGLETRASTFISGISDWSNDTLFLEMDSMFPDSRQNSARQNNLSRQSAEGRLSKSLKHWMPEYEIKSLPPQQYPPRQPVFSARLGNHVRIRRTESTESVDTLLSLLSCSSYESQSKKLTKRRRRRKKKQPEQTGGDERVGEKSLWVELASQKRGALDKMLRLHAMYAQLESETEIYKRLPEEEKIMVTKAGYRTGIILGPGRQRSDSASNIHKKMPKKKKPRRSQSAGGVHEGPMLDFREVRRQYVNQRLASLQQLKSRHSSRRSITHSLSRQSLTSIGSNDVWMGNTPRDMSPMIKDDESEEEHVAVWKGDSQILAIDLKRGLTAKVKSKITSTTSALDRATGFGDDNAPRFQVGTLEEYPALVEEDYSHVAKIPQRVRISPQLSDVIRTDIHVRMGRPRYHEIRIQDLEIWNRGQYLDRAHRNLKVFNWLHSLQESEFDFSLPEPIDDTPPGGDVTTRDEVVVSVDEPKIKPLLERLKHNYIVHV